MKNIDMLMDTKLKPTFIESHFYERLQAYVANPCFNYQALTPANPYQRLIRQQDIAMIDFNRPITLQDIYSNKNLILNKILLTIYEQDLLFLDHQCMNDENKYYFKQFYDPQFIALGKTIKPILERLIFHIFEQEIEVISQWKKNQLQTYMNDVITEYESTENTLCKFILSSANPSLAAKMTMIQMAPDFLTEASPMGRTVLGSFGLEQSEMMKIFIDEYGYGVHKVKHSTLFEDLLRSLKLNAAVHYYYEDYLPTSLMLINYFHYLTTNKSYWFKYLGALFYTEASIPHFNKQLSTLLKTIFTDVDTRYFDEHVHIDKHHSRMVMEKLILPSIDLYDEKIIDDILFGFESARLLQGYADNDLMQQIKFIEQLKQTQSSKSYELHGKERTFAEMKMEITSSHIHADDELFSIKTGELLFYASRLSPIRLTKNQTIIIPKGRVHSTIIESDIAHYTVNSIKLNEAILC